MSGRTLCIAYADSSKSKFGLKFRIRIDGLVQKFTWMEKNLDFDTSFAGGGSYTVRKKGYTTLVFSVCLSHW